MRPRGADWLPGHGACVPQTARPVSAARVRAPPICGGCWTSILTASARSTTSNFRPSTASGDRWRAPPRSDGRLRDCLSEVWRSARRLRPSSLPGLQARDVRRLLLQAADHRCATVPACLSCHQKRTLLTAIHVAEELAQWGLIAVIRGSGHASFDTSPPNAAQKQGPLLPPCCSRKSNFLSFIEVAYKTVNLLVVPLGGLFLMAIFVRWATPLGTIVGAASGLIVIVMINYWKEITGTRGISFLCAMPLGMIVQMIVGMVVSLLPVNRARP